MRNTNLSANGTSFHGDTVRATVNQLIAVCGEPPYRGDTSDKSQYDWIMETEDGKVFTIYDWKEYRNFGKDEVLEWHVGSHDSNTASLGATELYSAVEELN
jgi:hypothetical protein